MRLESTIGVIVLAQLAVARPAAADDELGVLVSVGAGASGYLFAETRDLADPAGAQMVARLTLGSRSTVALEVSYVRTWSHLDVPWLYAGALVGQGFQAAGRVVIADIEPWQVFGFAGVAWKRYATRLPLRDTNPAENTVELPLGAGISWRVSRVVFDLRATLRPTFERFEPSEISQPRELDTWGAGLSVGLEL